MCVITLSLSVGYWLAYILYIVYIFCAEYYVFSVRLILCVFCRLRCVFVFGGAICITRLEIGPMMMMMMGCGKEGKGWKGWPGEKEASISQPTVIRLSTAAGHQGLGALPLPFLSLCLTVSLGKVVATVRPLRRHRHPPPPCPLHCGTGSGSGHVALMSSRSCSPLVGGRGTAVVQVGLRRGVSLWRAVEWGGVGGAAVLHHQSKFMQKSCN